MAAVGLTGVRSAIAAAAARVGRHADDVKLVVVTKGRSPEDVMPVYEEGHRDFGENRAQELVGKFPLLPTDVRWHFVGRLQRNKARRVASAVVLLHSLDRQVLAAAWGRLPEPPPALVQVNIGREPQKAGVAPEEAEALCAAATGAGVPVAGLMAIAPLVDDPEKVRPLFAELAELRRRLAARWPKLTELSMGMSDDFVVAVEEGATIVRVGRAIFGTESTAAPGQT